MNVTLDTLTKPITDHHVMEGERTIRGVATEWHSIQDTREVEPCRVGRASVRETPEVRRGECCVIMDTQLHG